MMGELADGREPGAKRHQPMQTELPLPLTEPVIAQALVELSQGTARAGQSCLECYRSKRMSAADLLSFTRSISVQSASLAVVFKAQDAQNEQNAQDQSMGEAAGADDMAELMALWGSAPAPAPAAAPGAAVRPDGDGDPAPSLTADAARHQPDARDCDRRRAPACLQAHDHAHAQGQDVQPSDEEVALMQWWSQKRLPEIARR